MSENKLNINSWQAEVEIHILPRWLLVRFGLSMAIQRQANVFFSSILAIVAACIMPLVPHVCLFRVLFHLPCPGCGVLHAMNATLQLDLGRAWLANPAGLIFTIFLVFQIIASVVATAFHKTSTALNRLTKFGGEVVLASLVIVWLYRICLGGAAFGRYILS